jgi:hypothetical protein
MATIVSILIVPAEIVTVDDFPQDFVPEPLGNRHEVMALIQSVFPHLTYSDVFMEDKDPVHSFGFRDPSREVIKILNDRFGWRAYDPSEGRVFPPFDTPEYQDDADDLSSMRP